MMQSPIGCFWGVRFLKCVLVNVLINMKKRYKVHRNSFLITCKIRLGRNLISIFFMLVIFFHVCLWIWQLLYQQKILKRSYILTMQCTSKKTFFPPERSRFGYVSSNTNDMLSTYFYTRSTFIKCVPSSVGKALHLECKEFNPRVHIWL